MRTHYCGEIGESLAGRILSVAGWVHRRRDHGGGIFIFSQSAEFSHNRVEGNEIGRDLGYGWGGGIIVFNKGGKYKLSHNIFTGNFAPSLGSAFFVDEGAAASMDHDLVYGNVDRFHADA